MQTPENNKIHSPGVLSNCVGQSAPRVPVISVASSAILVGTAPVLPPTPEQIRDKLLTKNLKNTTAYHNGVLDFYNILAGKNKL